MKNKGFTLIELIAVITILAVIALITVPIITNFIEDSEAGSAERSAENYIKTVNDTLLAKKINTDIEDGRYLITNEGDLCPENEGTECSDPILVKVDGEIPISGYVDIEDLRVVKTTSQVGFEDYTVTYDDTDKKYVASKIDTNIPEPESFATDSWDTIAKNVKAGNLSKYKVGDTKEVTLNNLGTFTLRIANTTTPSECSTSGFSQTACGFVVEFEDIITTRGMNSTATNVGGWEKSEMRTYVNSTILNSLPTDLQNVIIYTTVVSGHGENDSSNFTTTDKLYLLSTKEVWGKEGTSNVIIYDTAEAKTRQLDYYKNKGVTISNYSGAIKQYNGPWWLRSAYSSNTSTFYGVISIGIWSDYNANDTCGVAAAFRIG